MAEGKGLLFRCRETQLSAHSDPTLVELILRNLTINALKYTNAGGVLLAARRKGASVALEVWDTGIGIDPKHHLSIFQEFHQLNNPARDRRKGLGLGLAIAKGLADRLGHPLTLRSQPGQGSVFRLVIPLHLGAILESSIKTTVANTLQGRVALVLDDDELAHDAMGSLLNSWGLTCLLAPTIAQAVKHSLDTRPDIFITDLRLGDVGDGFTAIAQVRQALQHDVPAIIVTGDTAPDRLREATQSGISLLHKPVRPQELRELIEAYCP